MTRTTQDYIADLQKHAAEARSLLTKPERERMVVRAFLRCLGTPFTENEIVASTEEPVDVLFRAAARFQLMEVLGGRMRGDDWRRRQQRYQSARDMSDLIESYAPSKPLSYREAANSVAENLAVKAAHYGAKVCATLDALVYIDLRNQHLWPLEPGPVATVAAEFRRQAWRSVSMLFVPYASVLFATPDAPAVLAEAQGAILSRWSDPDGLFGA